MKKGTSVLSLDILIENWQQKLLEKEDILLPEEMTEVTI